MPAVPNSMHYLLHCYAEQHTGLQHIDADNLHDYGLGSGDQKIAEKSLAEECLECFRRLHIVVVVG